MEAKPKRRLPLVLRLLITIVLAVILLATALIAYLTAVEFRPDAEQPAETVAARGADLESAVPATPYTLLSFNTGYAGLGEESDFFMDGGKQTAPRDPAIVEKNLAGIRAILEAQKCDFLFLQEVDRNAKRSRRIDEAEMLASVGAYSAAFAPPRAAYRPAESPAGPPPMIAISSMGVQRSFQILCRVPTETVYGFCPPIARTPCARFSLRPSFSF